MRVLWTARDLDLLETLTRRVRLLTSDQAARILWPHVESRRTVRRRLRKLAQAGLIERRVVNASPIPKPLAPLISWSAGDEAPDVMEAARQARSRPAPGAIPQEVITATKLAANVFGSVCHGLPPVPHRDRDLHLSEVYVFYRLNRPEEAPSWLNENGFSDKTKTPRADAFLVDSRQNTTRAIESAGRADHRAIAAFHSRLAAAPLPYELW